MKISDFFKTHFFSIIFTFINDFTLNSDNNGSPCSIRQSMTSSVRQFSMTSSVRQFVTDLRVPCSMTSSIRQFLRHD